MKTKQKSKWEKAMCKEILQLIDQKEFIKVSLNKVHHNLLDTHWVYTIKDVVKIKTIFKVCLVVKSYQQQPHQYQDLFFSYCTIYECTSISLYGCNESLTKLSF